MAWRRHLPARWPCFEAPSSLPVVSERSIRVRRSRRSLSMRVIRSAHREGRALWIVGWDHNMRTTVRYRDVATPDQSDPEFEPGDDIGILHEIGSRIAAADPLHAVLARVVQFITTVIPCDSCFVYVLDEDALVLRASKTPHPDVVDRLKLRLGQGITGWVAEHRQPVAVGDHAWEDPRFQTFNELPEDRY